MKKKILFIFAVMFIFSFGINASAEILPDDPQEYFSLQQLTTETKSFNIIKGNTSRDIFYDTDDWYLLTEEIVSIVEGGIIRYDGIIKGELGSIELDAYIYFENYTLIKYEVVAGEEIIYQVVNNDFEPNITICKELDLYEQKSKKRPLCATCAA